MLRFFVERRCHAEVIAGLVGAMTITRDFLLGSPASASHSFGFAARTDYRALLPGANSFAKDWGAVNCVVVFDFKPSCSNTASAAATSLIFGRITVEKSPPSF